jgi:NADH dehydrogenase
MPENQLDSSSDESRPITIAILGASGFIGRYLVFNLIQMGHRLRLFAHQTDPDFISPRGQIKTFYGSIENEQDLTQCFEECDLVFHLAGIIAETRNKTFENTVARGTARLVSAAQKVGVKKILYLSALGTTEGAESLYHKTKWEAEQLIINSGLDYTIFRPSIVYGIKDKFINTIARMIRLLPVVPVIGDGLYKLQPVYVEELCAVMAMSSTREFTSGRIFEIGGPEQLTYLEILDIIQRTIQRKRAKIHIPLSLARIAAYVLEKIIKPAPLTRDQLKMMAAGSTCDHTVVEKEFGVKFSPLETQLQKYLRN